MAEQAATYGLLGFEDVNFQFRQRSSHYLEQSMQLLGLVAPLLVRQQACRSRLLTESRAPASRVRNLSLPAVRLQGPKENPLVEARLREDQAGGARRNRHWQRRAEG